jgi:hypothetical protein
MAALTSSDVTITITRTVISGRKKTVYGTIAFGDGSKTYPTKGVPLPAMGHFGFKREINSMVFGGINELTTDYAVKYNPTSHTIIMYEEEATAAGGPLPECDTGEAPAARTYSFVAEGW